MSVIEVKDLVKTYRAFDRREGVWGSVRDLVHRDYRLVNAVHRISFSVSSGELVGYIGPNGAGKSTSIKMLTGILKPTSGEMSVLGYHPFKERCRYTKHIGVVFGQRTQLWWDIAVQESFKLLARIYDVPVKAYVERMEVFEEVLGLEKLLRTPVRKLSLGERMRCDLAASLLHQPEVLFLDEPTIGLDAVAKDGIRTFLKHVNKEFGTTIILTTHDLREIEELCARIIVLDHGVVVYDGSLETVRRMPGMVRRIVVDFVGDVPQEPLNGEFGGRVLFSQEGTRRMVGEFDPRQISSSELIRSLMAKYNVADVTIAEPNIEQVIMKIYKDGVP